MTTEDTGIELAEVTPVSRSGRRGGGRLAPAQDAYAAPPEEEAGTQIDLGKVLWRRKWTILILTLLGAGGGYFALTRAEPVYQSQAALHVRSNAPTAMGANVLTSGEDRNYANTQAALMRTGLVLGRAAARPGVADLPSFADYDSPVSGLAQSVGVAVNPQSGFLDVTAKAKTPEDSQDIVEAVIAAYSAYVEETYSQSAGDLLRELQLEKANAERDSEELWARHNELARQAGGLGTNGEQSSIQALELSQLSQELLLAQQEARDLNLTLEQAEAIAESPVQLDELLPRFDEGSSAEATQAEVAALRRELRALEYTSGASNARVRRLAQQIEDLEAELVDAKAADLEARMGVLRRRAAIADGRVEQLKEQYDARREQVLAVNSRRADMEKVRRDLAIVDDWSKRITQRVSEINVAESSGPARPQTVQPPGLGRQVEPKPAQLLGMGVVLGLMAGFGLAFLQEWLDPRMRTVEEIEDVLSLPALGTVPKFGDKESPEERARQMVDHPRGEAAESYRGLRTMLMATLQQRVWEREADGELDVRQAQTILVTSPLSGDGKTTLAANLATAFARLDRRTLIVDADTRRPRLHQYLLGDNDTEGGGAVGLTSVLHGEADLEDAIQESGIRNLSVLPCGPLPQDPVEMLNSENFVALLARLSRRFDRVIIDSPPVLPVTDARVLGAVTDATILVVRAGSTTRRAARVARDGLLRTGADVIGFVANDVKVSRKRFGYDAYTYSGPYSYGDAPPERSQRSLPGTNGSSNGHAEERANGQHD